MVSHTQVTWCRGEWQGDLVRMGSDGQERPREALWHAQSVREWLREAVRNGGAA